LLGLFVRLEAAFAGPADAGARRPQTNERRHVEGDAVTRDEREKFVERFPLDVEPVLPRIGAFAFPCGPMQRRDRCPAVSADLGRHALRYFG
jgi:hypothetical protein